MYLCCDELIFIVDIYVIYDFLIIFIVQWNELFEVYCF